MVRLLNVYTISAFVALGGVLYGFDVSSMSDIVGTAHYRKYYGNPLGIRQGGITSAIAAGSFFGALSSSVLADLLSRKVAIQLGTVLWCIGSSLQATSTGIPMLIIGRFISGLCIGVTSTVVPIYQSEIAPHKIRGRLVSFQQFAIALGIVIQYFIQFGCSFLHTNAVFRLPWAIQIVPAIFLFTGLFWLPRSPRWLASKDHWDTVLKVLAFLRTPNCDINDPLVLAEYKEIEEQILFEREQGLNSYGELFRTRRMRRRLFLGMAIQAWSQLSGVNVFLYYIIYILRSAAYIPTNPNPSRTLSFAAVMYIVFMVATLPTILWTDQWGRRSSLLVGSLSIAFWMYLIGGLMARFGQPNPAQNQPWTWVIIDHPAASQTIQASCYLAGASYAMSWGPIEWIYPPEIFPLRIRAKAVSFSAATNWAANFVLALLMPPLLRSIRWRLFIILGSLNIGAFIYTFFQVPETKQRTLEEMDEVFEHGEPVWRSFTGVRYSSRLDALAREFELGTINIHRPVQVEMHDDVEGNCLRGIV
ncbi:general substrate transporter [Lipomyces chichibuensis]|uniref:general substrate transporter n=1 Tax=Lipomyces chichibuensis TaxID=1546026 RepID=UPI003343320C